MRLFVLFLISLSISGLLTFARLLPAVGSIRSRKFLLPVDVQCGQMLVASAFRAFNCNFTVLCHVGSRFETSEAQLVLSNKALSFFNGFGSEGATYIEGVWLPVDNTEI